MTPLNRCARGPRYSVYVFALAFLSGWPGRVADAQVAPNAGNIPPAHSLVIPGDFSRGPSPDRAVRMRPLLDTVTTTLRRLEVHRTTLPPGASPHAPHRHAHEELMLVERGTLEVLQEGAIRHAGAGSLILQAANELHGLRNAGADTAVYWVIAIYPKDLADSTVRRR